MSNNREQQLVDILFQVASMTKIEKSIQSMKHEEYMGWVAKQLELCGFKTFPCGASWGVLERNREEYDYPIKPRSKIR